MEGVVVEQWKDGGIVGQKTSCDVDNPLTLLIGLNENKILQVINKLKERKWEMEN